MSLFFKLMIGGWTTAGAMFGLCALNASGKLDMIRKHISLWLELSEREVVGISEQRLELKQENVA
jgi:hypothetical protein